MLHRNSAFFACSILTESSSTIIQGPGFTNNYKFGLILTVILLTILPFNDYSKMARVQINTRNHTIEKPCMMNLQFLQNWEGKSGQ